jgi:hypothetical protein
MSSFIIDNCVVTSFGTLGHRICKINFYEKQLGFSVDGLIKITSGTRLGDNIIITKLCDGIVNIQDVINSWNNGNIHELVPW